MRLGLGYSLLLAGLLGGAACGGGDSADARVVADAHVAVGSVSLTWTVADTEGVPLDCGLLGNPDLQVVAVPRTGAQGTVVLLPCVAGEGTAMNVPAGTIDVKIRLMGSLGRFGDEIDVNGVEVPDGGNAELGAQAFSVSRKGGLTFSIDITNVLDNCTTEAAGGANVSGGHQLELLQGGTCIPGTVFDIGGTPFTSNCDGARSPCIEATQVVTLSNLDAGSYQIRLDGYENDQLCYPGLSTISIVGGDIVRNLGAVPVALLDPTPDGAAAPLCVSP